MNIDVKMSLSIIAVIAIVTIFTRTAPFLVFGRGKEVPPIIVYLGMVMPSAVIIMLIIYCLRNTEILSYPHGIPELISCTVVVGLHYIKGNTFLSIALGTALYMFLIQVVFA